MKAWVADEGLELHELPRPEAGPGEVLVRVRAFGMNRDDLAVDEPGGLLGTECVGEVVGPSAKFEDGDRVAVVLPPGQRGTYAEFVVVAENHVFPVDTALPWEVFGSVPQSFLTAYGVLFEAMETAEGQTVLVRGGSSALGMAAVSMLRELECCVYATTRKTEKVAPMTSGGVDHVLVDDGSGIAERLRATERYGVHGVVELVGHRAAIEDSLRCARRKGYVGLVGSLGVESDPLELPWMPSTVRLTRYSSEALETGFATPVLQNIVDKVEAGVYRSNLFKSFGFHDVRDAHALMSASGAVGKIVVTL